MSGLAELLFETDKYLRVKMPGLLVGEGWIK
jgi:hypothetical protein